jgi:integrase
MSIQRKGEWWYSVLDYHDAFGNRKQKWFKATKIIDDPEQKKALVFEGKKISELEFGKEILSKKTKLSAFFEKWLELEIENNVKPNTIYAIKCHIGKINKKMGHLPLEKITSVTVKEFINSELKSGRKASSTRIRVNVLEHALNFAVAHDLIAKNPCSVVKVSNNIEPTDKYFTDEEVDKIFKATYGKELFIPALLGILCGLRRAEICGLRWGDIDLKERVAHLRHNYQRDPIKKTYELTDLKTDNSSADIPLPEIVVSYLDDEYKSRPVKNFNKSEDYVWAQPNGNPYKPKQLSDRFKTLLDKLGIKGSPHFMRHTFCSNLYESGIDDKGVSVAARHADPNFCSKVYIHAKETVKRRSADAMDNKYGHLLENR